MADNDTMPATHEPSGTPLPQWVTHHRAANPGPFTLTGTNSYIIGLPGHAPVVVDAGPPLSDNGRRHLNALASDIRAAGHDEPHAVVTTHWHHDHTGALDLAKTHWPSAQYLSFDHAFGGGLELENGTATMTLGGLTWTFLHTPGHTHDSLCALVQPPSDHDNPTSAVVLGDTILGEGSSIVADPDGDVADYLASLDALSALLAATETSSAVALPGHGPVGQNQPHTTGELLATYGQHRRERLDQVQTAYDAGHTTVDALTDAVYHDAPPTLRAACEASIRAHLSAITSR